MVFSVTIASILILGSLGFVQESYAQSRVNANQIDFDFSGVPCDECEEAALQATFLIDPFCEDTLFDDLCEQEFAELLALCIDQQCRAVGGELIPIDSTAILIAGAQTNALSILGAFVAIGAIAFGALYITSKKK